MKIRNLQRVLWALLVGSAVTIGCVAEAAIDTGKLPLQTYVAKRVYCGNNPGATSNSYWIDANRDLVTIKQYSGEWAYGTYPNSKGQAVTRWFRMSDVLGNINFSNYETNMKQKQIVYRTESSGQTIGTVFNDENVVVVYEGGIRTQIIYRLSNNKGYKMGWVPNSSINKKTSYSSEPYRQQQPTGIPSNPIINNNISRPTNNTIDDVVPSNNPVGYQQWQGVANKRGYAYKDSVLKAKYANEWVDKGDNVTVLDEAGEAYYVEYEGRYRGKPQMKKRWVSKSVIDRTTDIGNNDNNKDNSTVIINDIKEKIWDLAKNGQMKKFKENTKFGESGQCWGFANKVYGELYGVKMGSQNLDAYNFSINEGYYNGSTVLGRIVEPNMPVDYPNGFVRSKNSGYGYTVRQPVKVSSQFKEDIKELFLSAKPGCFVQMGRRKSLNSNGSQPVPHSAILFNIDEWGVEFYEANADGRNTIQLNRYNWDKLANSNLGFSIYYPN